MRLIDADALVTKCGDYYVEEGPEEGFIGTLKSLIDTQPTVKDINIPSKWISVKDRLPETRHAVLVYTPHHKNIWAASMHEDGNWYIWSPGGKVLLDPDWNGPITHWMPLPEPPEVKQDD